MYNVAPTQGYFTCKYSRCNGRAGKVLFKIIQKFEIAIVTVVIAISIVVAIVIVIVVLIDIAVIVAVAVAVSVSISFSISISISVAIAIAIAIAIALALAIVILIVHMYIAGKTFCAYCRSLFRHQKTCELLDKFRYVISIGNYTVSSSLWN